MTAMTRAPERLRLIAWIAAVLGLLFVMQHHLLPALLAGLLVHELVHIVAPRLQARFASQRARLVAVALLASLVVGAVAAAVFAAIAFFRSDAGNLPALFARMAQILDDTRAALPEWLRAGLPAPGADAADELRRMTSDWLREHSAEIGRIGKEAGLTLAHILVGLIIGAMLATQEVRDSGAMGPLAKAFAERARRLADAFRRIVFAQVQISALNTVLTGLYLAAALPLFGVHLPLTKTMIAVTFIAGLLPVVGNLFSNFVIVVVSLAHSPQAAAASLVFLVVVHKLEYFLNARIVGSRIDARAWELLTAMLLLEAAFGIPGVVAAPIVYAWAKEELKAAGLV